jgi:hypothetical protein
MLPGGAHQVNPHMHVPVPGRLQYYRAEALPFIPNEIKTQLRFPKAYANSVGSQRYLDQVRAETQEFINENIKQNYFSGEATVGLNATLGEAEVMFAASDNVKALSDNGELKALHERFNTLSESAQKEYLSVRERVESIITATQSKEDEIYNEITRDFPDVALGLHNSETQAFSSVFNHRGFISVWNLEAIEAEITANGDAMLENHRNTLHALLAVKVEALDTNIILQKTWIDNVDNGSLSADELANFEEKKAAYQKVTNFENKDESAELLSSQLSEIRASVESA